jgi:hypothetical protein
LTRNKAWRLSLTAILGFGWLFLTPAYSDDPLSLAAQEIQKLNSSVSDLVYQDEFISLIDVAEDKYSNAVSAKEYMDSATAAYDASIDVEQSALEEKNLAQTAVDGQTATVALALTHKDDAQEALNIANLNLQITQSNMQAAGGTGLEYTVYSLSRNGNTAVPTNVICSGTWNSNSMQLPVCGNRYENIIVKFTGTITVPPHWTSTYFAGYTDDGFRMYVNGSLAVNNWREQGATWSPFSPIYDVSQDKTLDVEVWWYNGGGPGSYHLGWAIPGGWTGAGCDYTGGWGVGFSCDLNTFSSGSGATQEQTDAYNSAVILQQSAQQVYDDKLFIYNQEVQVLQTSQLNLTLADQNLTLAQQNLTNSLTDKNNSIDTYNQSIVDMNNAINNAWLYYDEQIAREIATALAQAAANAAANQPTPEPSPEPTTEPTPEPTPEPSPEQTQPVDPTPEPTPETTDEPKPEPTDEPTPEPTDEPTPEPTDEPTPEPTDEPTDEPTTEPTDNVEIKDKELEALIPEKGTGTSEDLSNVIANLTSKDNKLVVLSKEQVAAVSQTLVALTQEAKKEVAQDLGIKSSEVAVIAEAMKSNPELATAFVEFKDREAAAENATMPYTLADATTEVQTEAFLADPLGALTNIDFEKVLNPSEWGKDMTDDQREKAQEVVIPVIIASNIVAAAMTRRI